MSTRITLAAAVIGAVVSAATLVACPPAHATTCTPDDNTSVCLWEHPNYSGGGIPFYGSQYDLPTKCISTRAYISDPNLRIRSVGNNMAVSIAVYENYNCTGRQRIVSRGEWVSDIQFDAHSFFLTLAT